VSMSQQVTVVRIMVVLRVEIEMSEIKKDSLRVCHKEIGVGADFVEREL